MNPHVVGALCGLVMGCGLGFVKNKLVWARYLKKSKENAYRNESVQVYTRLIVNFFIDIAVLVVVFFFRGHMPFGWAACLLGVATGLVATSFATATDRK